MRVGDLEAPGAVVLPEHELRVVRNVLGCGVDGWELAGETGMRYSLTGTGMLGYAMLSSSTVREALRLLRRALDLAFDFFSVNCTDTPAGLLVQVDDDRLPADVAQFLLVRDLVAAFRVASLLLSPALLARIGDPEYPVRMQLATAESSRSDPHALLASFGLSVHLEFGAPRTAFTVPGEFLDRPLPAPDPQTAARCVRQCEQLLDERVRFTGVAAQIRHRLLSDPAEMPSFADLAKELGLSEPALHRRLVDAHTTYRGLLDQVRQLLAVELLAEGLSVEAVARQLGYSDTAAFSQAYHRSRGHPHSRDHDIPR